MRARPKNTGFRGRRQHADGQHENGLPERRAQSAIVPVARRAGELIQLRVPGELAFRDLVTRAVTKCVKVALEQRALAEHVATGPDFSHELLSAVGEAFNNVVLHAYKNTAPEPVTLVLRYELDYVEIELRDTGCGFDPQTVPEPDLEALPEGGMGIFIMKAFVDDIRYEAGPPNVLVLRKYFTPQAC